KEAARILRFLHAADQHERVRRGLREIGHGMRDGAAGGGTMAAIEPEFRMSGQARDKRPPRQTLQPCGPFSLPKTARDRIVIERQRSRLPERADRHARTVDLVAARNPRQGQIKKPAFILIDEMPLFLMCGKILTVTEKRRADP